MSRWILLAAVLLLFLPRGRAAAQVPTPESVIGWKPGADYKLADYGQIRAYFEALDAASDRIRVVTIGESAEGRPLLLAIISSEANMLALDRYREISRRLAAGTPSAVEARVLAQEGRVVVWIDGGLHATEVAGSQFSPAFAYRMVAGEEPEIRRIREEVILLLMPVMNPDGLEVVTEWYRRNVGTPFETVQLPVLYHKYAGHDNNRDWFMMLQPETRAVARQLWEEWYPQIVLNHHQTSSSVFPARLFIPPFADPVNPRIPPLVISGVNVIGTAMQHRFARERKPGVVSRMQFTQWWNGGMRTAPYFHNQIGILTEGALYRYATPKYHEPDSLPKAFRNGLAADRPSVWYPDPWRGGWWRLGDTVEYFVTASLGLLEAAADMREAWLYDAFLLGSRAIEAGRAEPFAYLVPLDRQHDPGEALEMLRALRLGGIQIHRATRGFAAGDEEYSEGTYVLFAAQPYRAHLLDLMEPQVYPDRWRYPGGPPATPYDLTGWTLPLQMGIDIARLDDPVDLPVEEVRGLPAPPGEVVGESEAYLLSPEANQAYRAVNRLLSEGHRVGRLTGERMERGRVLPPGTFVIWSDAASVRSMADELGLTFVAATGEIDAAVIREPSVGLYRSWVPSMDEGWTRWVLERYGFSYTSLRDQEIRGTDLKAFDVIVIPHQAPEDVLHGHLSGTMPDGYTGGMGLEGAYRLKRWVEDGGTLVALDGAADFAIEQFGLPLRDPVKDLPSDSLFVPGSLIRLETDPLDPIAYGLPEETAAFFVRSRAFEIVPLAGRDGEGERAGEVEREEVDVVARYAPSDLLLSGWELGADRHLGGRAAVVRIALGEGRIVLIGFRSHFRGQPRATFKLLFNSLLASTMKDLPGGSMVGTE
ncbi:MAG: M14 family metallopeptidase [Gemmatimonadetes bacterium]|nr:M14 family metallopeptidase [Gemmatimonadota bacterium]